MFCILFKVFNIAKYLSKVYNKLAIEHFEQIQLIIKISVLTHLYIDYKLALNWAFKFVKIKNKKLIFLAE